MIEMTLPRRRVIAQDLLGKGSNHIPPGTRWLIVEVSSGEASTLEHHNVRVKSIHDLLSITIWLPSGFSDLSKFVFPTPGKLDLEVSLMPWEYMGRTGCKVYLKSISHTIS